MATNLPAPSSSVFDDAEYTKLFNRNAIPFIKGAILTGGITDHRGSEVLISWVAGFACHAMCSLYYPWTQEHTRRMLDLARGVMST